MSPGSTRVRWTGDDDECRSHIQGYDRPDDADLAITARVLKAMTKVSCANWVYHVAAQGTPSDAGTIAPESTWVVRKVVLQVEIVLRACEVW